MSSEGGNQVDRRAVLQSVGSAVGISALGLQQTDIVTADGESLKISRVPFAQVKLQYEVEPSVERKLLVTNVCGSSTFMVEPEALYLTTLNVAQLNVDSPIFALNGKIRSKDSLSTDCSFSYLPIQADESTITKAVVRLAEETELRSPIVDYDIQPERTVIEIDEVQAKSEQPAITAVSKREEIELSEQRVQVQQSRDGQFMPTTVKPTISVTHHGELPVYGKEGHVILPKHRAGHLLEKNTEYADLQQESDTEVIVIPVSEVTVPGGDEQ